MFVGLVNRERRIRADRQRKEDRAFEEKSWSDRFKMQTDAAINTWQMQNEITNRQRIEAEERAAERTAALTAEDRAFQMDLLTLKRAYEIDDRDAAQQWWKDQQVILNEYATQRAVDDQNRLQAWDNERFERDRAAQQEDLKSELALRTEAANSQFDYQFNIRTEAAKEAAIAAHANKMQELLVERVMDGKVIGADFAAAVGGTTDPTAQIAQYSAAITALGVSKDNPVLAKLAGLNNPTVMKSTFETLQKYHTQIVESGQTGTAAIETFMEGANEYLGNIQITPADLAKPDALIKQMETILGKPLDSLTKSIIKSSVGTVGSAVAVTEPTLVEPLDVSKLGEWKEVITENAVARGRSEKTALSKAKTSALEMSKSGNNNQQAMSKILLDWIGKRDLQVSEALDSVKNKDYYGVVSLYGNNVIAEAKAAQPKLETAILPDYMRQAKDAAPIEVLHTNEDGTPAPTASVLKKLIEMNIIKAGDVVTFTNNQGETVTMTYKGE
jgi:hypothetical protein